MTFKTAALATAAALAFTAAPALAQDYPTQPITIVVPFSAGGPTDTVARLVAQSMSSTLGQQVLVENVGGAGGTLGAGQVAQAEADGYRLLIHHIGMSTAPSLYRDLPFDPLEDFSYVGLITSVPMTIIARRDFEPETGEELVAYLRENGEDITYANAGIGAASHLCGMLLQEALGVQMITVPYQGTGPAMTDILGGQVDLMCDQTTNTTNQINNGEVKAYAVTSEERLDSFPDLPTTAEIGLDQVQVGIWHGLYGPAGLDDAVVERLREALETALEDPTVVERFANLGTAPEPADRVTPDALQEQLSSQIELWQPVIERAGEYAD